jgi:hypothetical protein
MMDSNNLIGMPPYVTINRAAELIGLTQKAIRRKIEEGVWLDGREYRRGSDGRIYISIKGFSAWVEAGSMSGRSPSASRSRSMESRSAAPSI